MLRLLIAASCLLVLTKAASQIHRVPMLDGRIVGGEATDIEHYPYQASMLYYSEHKCGAVIISEDYVLTAGHCTPG